MRISFRPSQPRACVPCNDRSRIKMTITKRTLTTNTITNSTFHEQILKPSSLSDEKGSNAILPHEKSSPTVDDRKPSQVSPYRLYFDSLAETFGIETLDDWYGTLSSAVIKEHGGLPHIPKESNQFHSPVKALMTAYPEHNWMPWKFQTVPFGFWKSTENQRKYFDWLADELGIKELDDWYEKLSPSVLRQHNGHCILRMYNSSPSSALIAAYPEHNWIPWKFNVADGFWKSTENQRKYFDWLGKELGVSKLEDWYEHLSQVTMKQHGGSGLLNFHKGSPTAALMAAYPEHNWIPWKFGSVTAGFWKSKENQRKYFDWLGHQIGIKQLDDWYEKLSASVGQEYGVGSLSHLYSGSPTAALMASYPEHNWIPWKFNNVPRGFWKSIDNQRKYFDWLGKEIGIKQLDDWYEKLSCEVMKYGGGLLMNKLYKGSPIAALMAAYPEHDWIPWKFSNVTKGTWNSKDNINAFLSELSEKLSIQTLDDWYRVDLKQLGHLGARALLAKYRGLYNMLKEQYPHHPWDPKRFSEVGKKGQKWLAITLKKMFPNEDILEDYMHPQVKLRSTSRPLQLDVFIPSRSLAFEYQGIQHYEEIGFFQPTRTYQQRDEEKRNLCAANNIKLIEVPYWWNRTQESLQEMMSTH